MRDTNILLQLVSDLPRKKIGLQFLSDVPHEFYEDTLKSEDLDSILSELIIKLLGDETDLNTQRLMLGDYERAQIIYTPLISVYPNFLGLRNGTQYSNLSSVYFFHTLSKHLSNRIINNAYEYLIHSPRDFDYEIEGVEYTLTFILERWSDFRNTYSPKSVKAIVEKRELESIYLPIGIVLLWVYAELKEIDALANNLVAPKIEELYVRFPFDPNCSGLKKNLADLNERLVKRFFKYHDYSKEGVIHLVLGAKEKLNNSTVDDSSLTEIAYFRNSLETQIKRLLNLIFLKEYCKHLDPLTYDSLDDSKFLIHVQHERQSLIQNSIKSTKSDLDSLLILNSEFQRIESSFYPLAFNQLSVNSQVEELLKYLIKQKDFIESRLLIKKILPPNNERKPRHTFGFVGDDQAKKDLLTILSKLFFRIGLVNEFKTTVNDLYEMLIAENITTSAKKVFLGCDNLQFVYIISKLKSKFRFDNLRFSVMGDSKVFYSKEGTLLKKSNLSTAQADLKKTVVKEKETIDKIFTDRQ